MFGTSVMESIVLFHFLLIKASKIHFTSTQLLRAHCQSSSSVNQSLRQLHEALVGPQTRVHCGHFLQPLLAVLPVVGLDVALHRLA